jgi:hypothetical protein
MGSFGALTVKISDFVCIFTIKSCWENIKIGQNKRNNIIIWQHTLLTVFLMLKRHTRAIYFASVLLSFLGISTVKVLLQTSRAYRLPFLFAYIFYNLHFYDK